MGQARSALQIVAPPAAWLSSIDASDFDVSSRPQVAAAVGACLWWACVVACVVSFAVVDVPGRIATPLTAAVVIALPAGLSALRLGEAAAYPRVSSLALQACELASFHSMTVLLVLPPHAPARAWLPPASWSDVAGIVAAAVCVLVVLALVAARYTTVPRRSQVSHTCGVVSPFLALLLQHSPTCGRPHADDDAGSAGCATSGLRALQAWAVVATATCWGAWLAWRCERHDPAHSTYRAACLGVAAVLAAAIPGDATRHWATVAALGGLGSFAAAMAARAACARRYLDGALWCAHAVTCGAAAGLAGATAASWLPSTAQLAVGFVAAPVLAWLCLGAAVAFAHRRPPRAVDVEDVGDVAPPEPPAPHATSPRESNAATPIELRPATADADETDVVTETTSYHGGGTDPFGGTEAGTHASPRTAHIDDDGTETPLRAPNEPVDFGHAESEGADASSASIDSSRLHGAVGRYRLSKQLGTGAYASVWLSSTADGGLYAVKVSKPTMLLRKACELEATVLQQVNTATARTPWRHLFVKLVESFLWEGQCVLVLELCGPSLWHLNAMASYRGVPRAVVREVMRQLLSALTALHDCVGLLHADVKLENVLLADAAATEAEYRALADGTAPPEATEELSRVKLVDFGTCRKLDTQRREATLIQTREYRAPEVIVGVPDSQITGRTDVWSAVCVAYELLTGCFLFDAKAQGLDGPEDAVHLALMRRLLGELPAALTRGRHAGNFFDKGAFTGPAYAEEPLHTHMQQHFVHLFDSEDELAAFTDFAKRGLNLDPAKRATAAELQLHRWLQTSW